MLETTSVSAGGRVLTTVVKVFDLIIDGREATLPRLCQKISEARYGWGAGLPSQEKNDRDSLVKQSLLTVSSTLPHHKDEVQ